MSGTNWANWEKLLAFLKTRKPRQVNMGPWLQYDGIALFSGKRVTKARECGTVGCIHGWGDVLFRTDGDADMFRRRLGIDHEGYSHLAVGLWSSRTSQHDLGKREVIRYMTKALKEKNVMVRID